MAFMDHNFLLENTTAGTLYRDYAVKMPIIDYHCHINAAEILENKKFANITDAWLSGDHYKWRLMRANGIAEKYITGDGTDFEKFAAFAQVMPRSAGNPVYHWAHLELQRFFGCKTPLSPDTAQEIWDFCNAKIENDERLRVRGMIACMRVEVIVTTDDPADDLGSHKKLAADESFKTRVLPGWRPGALLDIESAGFSQYIFELGEVAGIHVADFDVLKSILTQRMEYFNKTGCRTADHGIRQLFYTPAADSVIDDILKKRLSGESLTPFEANQYRYSLMNYLGKEYARLGWVMQLHLGVLRNVNTGMFKTAGPDTGFDCVDPMTGINGIAEYLNELNNENALPKTLIFSINPTDNLAVTTLAGCFTGEGIRSKVQQGSAWWFNDTYTGMEQQMINFAESSVFANFVGMLTDSRSFLSYTRHEYFRRLLCNILGGWVETGRYPDDMNCLESIVKDICYNNAKEFFGF